MIFQEELLKSLKRNSKRTAIESDRQSMSFENLLINSNKITQFLLDKKLDAETRIGLELSDRPAIIISMIGVINARCIIVPIDPSTPKNRRASMLADLNLSHLIKSIELEKSLNTQGIEVSNTYVFEDIIRHQPELGSSVMKYPKFQIEDGIYIYFTSGSTGKPKGIIGKNSSLIQFLKWEIMEFGIDHTFRVSQFISPYFDAFLRDIFVPLLAGGTICIPPSEDDFLTPNCIVSWIDQFRITLIHCVPSLFRVIDNGVSSITNFKQLKYILLSGEKITPSSLVKWYTTFGSSIQLVNLYGTTETTLIKTFYRIQPEDVNKSKISIGEPIPQTQLLVASGNDLKESQVYVPGDLYILSKYLTKGYLNQPKLNSEKFTVVNVGTSEETIAFKTGDKARRLACGEIELIGREDRQIKLNGIRIELDEIENVLSQSEFVANVIVMLDEHKEIERDTAKKSIIAFVIRARDIEQEIDLSQSLSNYIRDSLPQYMTPSNYVEVQKFPLLSNGKIDFKELLRNQNTKQIVAPVGPLEKQLLIIWTELLGTSAISTKDNFHRIGGDSLSLMRLIAKIYNNFNVRISLNDLFKNLTIQKQSILIGKSKKDNLFVISKAKSKSRYHLSASQERVFYFYLLDKKNTAFNMPIALELEKNLDLIKIKQAITSLVVRHESLRTKIVFNEGKNYQQIQEDVDFEVQEIVTVEDQLTQTLKGLVQPFNLGEAPLIRCSIVIVGNSRKILFIDIHHIISDGISQSILLSEFRRLYRDKVLDPLPIQFKDYAEWEYQFRMTDEYIGYREFWLKTFEKSVPELTLPIANRQIKDTVIKGANLLFQIDKSDLDPIFKKLRKNNITAFSCLFSIFALYLYQLSGQDDIVIGINTSGRLQDELFGTVGMLTKTLPIRTKINPANSFIEYVRCTHNNLLEANNRQLYDLADILSELNRNSNSSIDSLFDVMFVFQNFGDEIFEDDFSQFANLLPNDVAAKYPLVLIASENNDEFEFRLQYQTSYFTAEDAKLICNQFTALSKLISRKLDANIGHYLDFDFSSHEYMTNEISFKF